MMQKYNATSYKLLRRSTEYVLQTDRFIRLWPNLGILR